MKTATISRGGQISIPAEIRHRWGATRVILVDHGTSLELRPVPADPIAALRGSLRTLDLTSDEIRAQMREEEAEAEERKFGG
ncbi:MAG TPA: AbrB/MazE/SpoVT family DNA-binding domain-containing protein [Candidatus Limnocylindrales bacterium]